MPIPTEDVRISLLNGHFNYEVRRILEDVDHMIFQGVVDSQSGIMRVLEVVLIDVLVHIRILHEFFYGREDGENAHVKHYIPSWNKQESEEIKSWNKQINQFLSHLDYARVTVPYRYYPVLPLLYPHFKDLIIEFLDSLPDIYKTDIMGKLLEDLRQRKI